MTLHRFLKAALLLLSAADKPVNSLTSLNKLFLGRPLGLFPFILPSNTVVRISIDTNIISSTSTSTCTYIDIDNISTYIDIEINVWSIPKFTCMFVCLFVCGFICDIATGHTNEATIMKFGMKGRCVKF